MIRSVRIALAAFFVLSLSSATSFAARSDPGGMPQFRGDWHPVVGAGAVYQVDNKVPETNLKQTATLISKEQITTPAGTFSCDHYQTKELKYRACPVSKT